MKRKLVLLGLTMGICLSSAFTASAAWSQQGNLWQYQEEGTSAFAVNKWVNVNGLWYHFDENGIMQTGWLQQKKKWYYLDLANGHMRTGWIQDLDGKWYYLDESDGYMWKKRRTPDGYYVDESGVYDATKGNGQNDSSAGPNSVIAEKKKAVLLRGVEFPELTAFASQNLSTELWGAEGSLEALNRLNLVLPSPVELEENSLVYRVNGVEKLRLSKAGDHYEIADYGTIDSDMETVLLAMCNMISSKPQDVYNGIYTAAEYDQRVMRSEYYTNFGDAKVLYRIYDDHVSFWIAAK